jgi:DNA-binding NtrC family response regulator
LIVDSDVNARTSLATTLSEKGYEVQTAGDAVTALGKHDSFAPHVVVTALEVTGMDGIELVKRLHASDADVIVTSAFSRVSAAVEAIRSGAADYLSKPINVTELLADVDKLLEHPAPRGVAPQLRARGGVASKIVVGASLAMQRVFEAIERAAASTESVLITGEPGTGKEFVAHAIHQGSTRASGAFVHLHCAALAEASFETSLADAMPRLRGGGTLFLDEIGELAPSLQLELLRVLDEEPSGVRVIAATRLDLDDEVSRGRFRADLHDRLAVIRIAMPPLRERRSDIVALATCFLERYAKENGKAIDGFAPGVLEVLSSYDWAGNVRELESAIEGAVVLAMGPFLEVRHLPAQVRPRAPANGMPVVPGASLSEIERYAITETLAATGGSTSRAAEILGISVRTVQYRLHQYNEAPRSEVSVVRIDRP